MNKTKSELKPGDLDKFIIDMYYSKNPHQSSIDIFQRQRIFVHFLAGGDESPPEDLATQHLIGANSMLRALTEDKKLMLYNRYSNPAYLKLIEDMAERAHKQFRKEKIENLILTLCLKPKVNTDNPLHSDFEDIVKRIL